MSIQNASLNLDSPLHPFKKTDENELEVPYTSKECVNIETQLNYTYSVGSFDGDDGAAEELGEEYDKRFSTKKLVVTGIDRALFQGSIILKAYAKVMDKEYYLGHYRKKQQCNLQLVTSPPNIEGSPTHKPLYVRMNVIMGDPEQLLLQGQYDEEQLARQLFDRYYTPLHYLAFSLLDDNDEAADVVQDTLLIALKKIENYRPGTDLKAWLCRIAIYRCRDVMRWRKAREKWYAVWSRVAMLGAPPRTPERHTADHELRGELWQAVDNLGEKHRLPLILFYVHGLSAAEIAEMLEIREGTVYSRLHYACRKLAGQFTNSELESWAEEILNE